MALNFSIKHKPAMIADAGSRHYGKVHRAYELIEAARLSGCDAIEFDAYGKGEDSLSDEDWNIISCMCAESGLPLGITCWDTHALGRFKDTRYKPAFYKIPDTITNRTEMIDVLDHSGRVVLLSTGMATIAQIDTYLRMFKKAQVVLMHSTNMYPCPREKTNLNAIKLMVRRYGNITPVGYSSHESSHPITMAAIGAGAVVIEKSIIIGDDEDPEECLTYTITPYELGLLVKCISDLYPAMGDGQKTIYKEELDNSKIIAKT